MSSGSSRWTIVRHFDRPAGNDVQTGRTLMPRSELGGWRRMEQTIPLPPREYALRVGCVDSDDAMEIFVRLGLDIRHQILETVPEAGSGGGRRFRDFGRGGGRPPPLFVQNEPRLAETHGADIDSKAVGWVRKTLCPPIASA